MSLFDVCFYHFVNFDRVDGSSVGDYVLMIDVLMLYCIIFYDGSIVSCKYISCRVMYV